MNKLHTNREYEAELHTLRQRLMDMAFLVREMIAQSIQALQEKNADLAHATIERDHKVNRDEMELDEFCLLLLAKRQPLARDLRFITQVLKMVTDLERMGDLAVNICERALKMAESKLPSDTKISQMAQLVDLMMQDALQSFLDADADLAEAVLKRDDELDELYHIMSRDLIEKMTKSHDEIEPFMHIQAVAKWLERIGDHCTNLAENVVFMVRGTDIRHAGKLDEIKHPRLNITQF